MFINYARFSASYKNYEYLLPVKKLFILDLIWTIGFSFLTIEQYIHYLYIFYIYMYYYYQ